jgi:hypothetical protein
MEERIRKKHFGGEMLKANKLRGEWDTWAHSHRRTLNAHRDIIAGGPNCRNLDISGALEIIRRTNPYKKILKCLHVGHQ